MELSCSNDSVMIVSEDVDLLILLALASFLSNFYLVKPGKGKIHNMIYSFMFSSPSAAALQHGHSSGREKSL